MGLMTLLSPFLAPLAVVAVPVMTAYDSAAEADRAKVTLPDERLDAVALQASSAAK